MVGVGGASALHVHRMPAIAGGGSGGGDSIPVGAPTGAVSPGRQGTGPRSVTLRLDVRDFAEAASLAEGVAASWLAAHAGPRIQRASGAPEGDADGG